MSTAQTIDNPLTTGSRSHIPQPCQFVIFGAAGDLSWRKLLPALYNLNVDGVLPSNFAIVGFGLGSEGDADEWIRARAKDGIQRFSRQPLEDSHWNDFCRLLHYVEGSFNDSSAYDHLKAKMEALDQQFGIPGSRVYYLSIPPKFIDMCVSHLHESDLIADHTEQRSFSRVIVEKPIGHDLAG